MAEDMLVNNAQHCSIVEYMYFAVFKISDEYHLLSTIDFSQRHLVIRHQHEAHKNQWHQTEKQCKSMLHSMSSAVGVTSGRSAK